MKVNTVGYFEIQSSNPEEIRNFILLCLTGFIKDENLSIEYYRMKPTL